MGLVGRFGFWLYFEGRTEGCAGELGANVRLELRTPPMLGLLIPKAEKTAKDGFWGELLSVWILSNLILKIIL